MSGGIAPQDLLGMTSESDCIEDSGGFEFSCTALCGGAGLSAAAEQGFRQRRWLFSLLPSFLHGHCVRTAVSKY